MFYLQEKISGISWKEETFLCRALRASLHEQKQPLSLNRSNPDEESVDNNTAAAAAAAMTVYCSPFANLDARN